MTDDIVLSDMHACRRVTCDRQYYRPGTATR